MKENFEDMSIDGRITVKLILKKQNVKM